MMEVVWLVANDVDLHNAKLCISCTLLPTTRFFTFLSILQVIRILYWEHVKAAWSERDSPNLLVIYEQVVKVRLHTYFYLFLEYRCLNLCVSGYTRNHKASVGIFKQILQRR